MKNLYIHTYLLTKAQFWFDGSRIWQPSSCKKPKKIQGKKLFQEIRDAWRIWMIPNWSWMIRGSHSWSFRTNLVSFRTFRRHWLPNPVSWQGLFCHFLKQSGSSVWFVCAWRPMIISTKVAWKIIWIVPLRRIFVTSTSFCISCNREVGEGYRKFIFRLKKIILNTKNLTWVIRKKWD